MQLKTSLTLLYKGADFNRILEWINLELFGAV